MERDDIIFTLNYNRPIGKHWKLQVNTAYANQDYTTAGRSTAIQTGKILIYPELLVPSASGDNGVNITALANVIYEDARVHNMSLAAYGHLDPSKFAIAAGFVALMLQETRRDLCTYGKYEFGNRTLGDLLTVSATGYTNSQLDDKILNLVKKYNRLVLRLNQLYIPGIEIFADWMSHRCKIYRDDEGERYQVYFYRMSNYYKLDVDASSATVGQLIFEMLPYSRNGSTIENISDRLDRIDALLAEYEADDDMVSFSTEAIKAGMCHLALPTIPVNLIKDDSGSSIIDLPRIEFEFDVDDVFSVENAYFVEPAISRTASDLALPFSATGCSWDIKENISTGKFEVGKLGTTTNVLPIVHPCKVLGHNGSCANHGDSINRRPLFTHAKITSIEGIRYLTKYMAASGETAVAPLNAIASTTYPNQLLYYYNGDTFGAVPSTGIDTVACLVVLDTHGITLLQAPIMMSLSNTNTTVHATTHTLLAGCYTGNMFMFNYIFRGFKGRPYMLFYNPSSGDLSPVWLDYDYITSVSKDNLDDLNSSFAWNGFLMVPSIVKDSKGKSRSNRRFSGKSKGGNKPTKPSKEEESSKTAQ